MRIRNIFDNVNSLSKIYLKSVIKEGDICIDATMGKGYDTLFMAESVGESGFVYAFDVQSEAIEKTKENLNKQGIYKNVKLILDGHENLDKYVSEKISCAVFNLGYLPGCEHMIVTKPDTTIKAIEKCINLLKENGVVCICVYLGHEGGMEEGKAIFEYVSSLNQKKFNVFRTQFINQINNPPEIIVIEKKKL